MSKQLSDKDIDRIADAILRKQQTVVLPPSIHIDPRYVYSPTYIQPANPTWPIGWQVTC